ncbi:Aste57867_5223 [Aphanomyces stellatus]|uniref:Protein DPCD n=1 Tax=Aphanomyces stellatus TaxID=120398 RepID=A0A485KGI5_9STRA|nr:hypothetical protein As57867_005210 [Aphanomyces stellatus]VFT82296.1 Aste57867_5223 [Aphanomyces stellatus]
MFRGHPGGTSNCAVAGGRARIHTTFADGVEMVEEYSQCNPPQILVRRWKAPTALGGDGKWEFEVGEPTAAIDVVGGADKNIGIAVNGANPIFVCREATEVWEWRVRNLPYPKDTYLISIDNSTQEIVIRTTNKKYYKRFRVPAMARANLPLDTFALSHSHANNTLVIQYDKPEDVIEAERKSITERLKGSRGGANDPQQCRQQ